MRTGRVAKTTGHETSDLGSLVKLDREHKTLENQAFTPFVLFVNGYFYINLPSTLIGSGLPDLSPAEAAGLGASAIASGRTAGRLGTTNDPEKRLTRDAAFIAPCWKKAIRLA
jgi:hypothetical protein